MPRHTALSSESRAQVKKRHALTATHLWLRSKTSSWTRHRSHESIKTSFRTCGQLARHHVTAPTVTGTAVHASIVRTAILSPPRHPPPRRRRSCICNACVLDVHMYSCTRFAQQSTPFRSFAEHSQPSQPAVALEASGSSPLS